MYEELCLILYIATPAVCSMDALVERTLTQEKADGLPTRAGLMKRSSVNVSRHLDFLRQMANVTC